MYFYILHNQVLVILIYLTNSFYFHIFSNEVHPAAEDDTEIWHG